MASKVYYNSACPVCNAGIINQRKRMEACGIKDIKWIDVHTYSDRAPEVGATLEQVREKLHVKHDNGHQDTGVNAFIYLWQQTPSQRWFGTVCQLPIVNPFAHLAYNCFARLLYQWNCFRKRW